MSHLYPPPRRSPPKSFRSKSTWPLDGGNVGRFSDYRFIEYCFFSPFTDGYRQN